MGIVEAELMVKHTPCYCAGGKSQWWCQNFIDVKTLFLRKFEGQVWQRFAVIPHIVGQKYTFGNTFTSREEQGEFLFSSKVGKHDPEGINVFEIKCDKANQFWIKPLKHDIEIYINNAKIHTQSVSELNFGDMIEFSRKLGGSEIEEGFCQCWDSYGDDEDEQITDDDITLFLFIEKEMDSENSATTSTSTITQVQNFEQEEEDGMPYLNLHVMSPILSYLSISELKNARFVSSLWNDEGLKLLRTKTVLNLDYNKERSFYHPSHTLKLFNIIQDMNRGIFIPTSVNIDFHPFESIRIEQKSVMTKFKYDLNQFLDEAYLITHLKLDGLLLTIEDSKYRIEILKNQNLCNNLTSLELAGSWNLDATTWDKRQVLEHFGQFAFPRLCKFILSIITSHNGRDHPTLAPWLRILMNGMKAVSNIQLKCTSTVAFVFIQNSITFHNLANITMHYTDIDGLRWLNTLKNPLLKKLELSQLVDWNMQEIRLFEELLQKNAKSLKSLQFILTTIGKDKDNHPTTVYIQLPVFPVLTTLNIGWDWIDRNNIMSLKFTSNSDSDNILSYQKHFPMLKILTLWPTGFGKYPETEILSTSVFNVTQLWNEHYSNFYELFFTNPNRNYMNTQICKTLLVLDIPYASPNQPSVLFPWARVNVNMFPNVFNPWMNLIRL